MRFKTKFDRWLVIVLALTGSMALVVPVSLFLSLGSQPGPPWWLLAFPLVWLAVVSCALPQYYEALAEGLFICQGWRKTLLAYESLVEVQSVSYSQSAAVFLTDRIVIVTRNTKRFVIAVAADDRFFAELAKRCPLTERRAFGLGTFLSPPLIL